jgi:isocitrate dehydrogenase (NAD+)
MSIPANREITLIPGDGIGPEITAAVKEVFAALALPFTWVEKEAGEKAYAAHGVALPPDTVASIRKTGLALKGPLGTPSGGGYRSATVQMREELELYANIRPAQTLTPGRFQNVDILLFRENLQGLYAAEETWVPVDGDPHGKAVATAYNTKENLVRLIRFAANQALLLGRKKITLVHKSNILKALSGISLEALDVVKQDPAFAGLLFETMIVDACAMKLVMKPEDFDVIVTTNLFGDILSDLTAGIVGGLGLAPGANIGDHAALFEPVHGTAPDIAGKNIANPSAILMAAAMLLDYVDQQAAANRIRSAIIKTIEDGQGTGDVGGPNGTSEFLKALIARL